MVRPLGDNTRELLVGARLITLALGDITTVHADAIVNAANEPLVGGGGVDGAIHRAGGRAIMADLEARYGRERRCPTGQAVASVAGRLNADWVIHAVGPIWRGGGAGEAAKLRSAYANALRVANELGARSVAAPAISAGVYGYPLEAAARIALDTAVTHLSGATGITRIDFVLFSERTLTAFERALADIRRDAESAGALTKPVL